MNRWLKVNGSQSYLIIYTILFTVFDLFEKRTEKSRL